MEFKKLSFLIVEDHDFQRNTMVRMLEGLQAKCVYAASDGVEALRLLENMAIKLDIIISDLDMPNMDGMEFIRHLAAGGYGASLILASSLDASLLGSVETMTKAYGVNLLGAVKKPVTPASLTDLLARHVPSDRKQKRAGPSGPTFTLGEIMHGLEKNEFEAFLQPKLEVATRKIVGAEALARWRHPQLGLIPPSAFIKTLEDSGEIDALMWVMLGKSAAFCSALRAAGFDAVIAVNLSLKSLTDTDLASRIVAIMQGYNVDPARICLEVTESACTTNVAQALENLTRLRMRGFGLSIDDYGTGYSSMQQLTRIPFTEIKIDGSFVTNASTRNPAKVVLGSSLEMARKLNIVAVAEGVETQQDWDLLGELGCDYAQGYLIAKPMAGQDYITWQKNVETNPMTIATR